MKQLIFSLCLITFLSGCFMVSDQVEYRIKFDNTPDSSINEYEVENILYEYFQAEWSIKRITSPSYWILWTGKSPWYPMVFFFQEDNLIFVRYTRPWQMKWPDREPEVFGELAFDHAWNSDKKELIHLFETKGIKVVDEGTKKWKEDIFYASYRSSIFYFHPGKNGTQYYVDDHLTSREQNTTNKGESNVE